MGPRVSVPRGLGAIAASAITSLAEPSVLSKYACQTIDEVKRHLAFPCVERDHFAHDCVQVYASACTARGHNNLNKQRTRKVPLTRATVRYAHAGVLWRRACDARRTPT